MFVHTFKRYTLWFYDILSSLKNCQKSNNIHVSNEKRFVCFGYLSFLKSPRQLFKMEISDPHTRFTKSKSVLSGPINQSFSSTLPSLGAWGLHEKLQKVNVMARQGQLSQ